MQEEPVSSIRASPNEQKQNDITWLQDWAEDFQTVDWSYRNGRVATMKRWNGLTGVCGKLVRSSSARGRGSTALALTVPTKPSHFAHGHGD